MLREILDQGFKPAFDFNMQIAIIGYGKMGKAVERIAISKGYTISCIMESETDEAWNQLNSTNTQVAIEFSEPDSALPNIRKIIQKDIPVVCGTTGWWQHLPEIKEIVSEQKGTLIYGGNFSVGMNLLFQLNQVLAGWMNHFPEYDPWILEKHHSNKKDAPGGSAKMLADQIVNTLNRKSSLASLTELTSRNPNPEELSLGFIRSGAIIGEHEVGYSSPVDSITLQHQAMNRDGFAQGALLAAQWALNKKGVWDFSDLIAQEIR